MELIPVDESHWGYILDLRNSDSVRKECYDTNMIPMENHIAYMKKFQTNDHWHQWIISVNGKIVGHAKIVDGEFGYMLDSKYRGKGYGSQLCKKIIEECERIECNSLMAIIRSNNQNSISMVENNGFKKTETKKINNEEYVVLTKEGIS